MENASKAILIAGAVLIVLILIGISLAFIAETDGFTELFSDNISQDDINSHNAKFLMYEQEIRGTQAITILSMVEANNKENKIKVTAITDYGNVPPNSAGNIISSIKKNIMYNYRVDFDSEGIVTLIRIYE